MLSGSLTKPLSGFCKHQLLSFPKLVLHRAVPPAGSHVSKGMSPLCILFPPYSIFHVLSFPPPLNLSFFFLSVPPLPHPSHPS